MLRSRLTLPAIQCGVLCCYLMQTWISGQSYASPLWAADDNGAFDSNSTNDTTSSTATSTSSVTSSSITMPSSSTATSTSSVTSSSITMPSSSTATSTSSVTSSGITMTSPSTAPAKVTTRPNTIAPGPSVSPPSQLYLWTTPCVSLAVFNITFQYAKPGLMFDIVTDIPTLNTKYKVEGPRVQGSCSTSNVHAHIEMYWESSRANTTEHFNFTIKFVQKDGEWEAVEFTHRDTGEKTFRYNDQAYFLSPLDTAFKCDHRVTHSIDSSGVVEFYDIKVQAFTFGQGFSKSVNECPEITSRKNNVGLIVGASIGSIIVVGIIAILIGKSAHREYELLK